MNTCRRIILAALTALLITAAPALAQVNTATVYATATDGSGAVIPGATVTLTHVATNVVLKRTTNEVGIATFDFLPIGLYKMEIEADGFKKFEGRNLDLKAGMVVRNNFPLEVGTLTETVVVEDVAPLVQTSTAEQLQTFESRKVEELPLSRRNFTGILSLNTGVSQAGEGVRLNGQGRSGTAFAVDGGEASSNPEGRGAAVYQSPNYIDIMSIEGVQEVQVVKGITPAEYGNIVGGQVQIITKSGTNQFHGSLFHGIRADNLNAADSYLKSQGIGKTPEIFNQFGGSVGGPIVKNRIFFFVDYEGYRERRLSQIDGNVPTPELRTQMIQAVPGYKQVLDFYPEPNQAYSPGDTDAGYVATASEIRDDNHLDAKGDFRLTNFSNLALTYARGRPFRETPSIYINGGNNRTWSTTSERGTANYVFGGPTWTSESRFNYSLNDMGRLDAFFLQQYDNGLTEDQQFDNRLPRFDTNLGWGGPGAELFLLEGYAWNLSEKIALTRGKHSIKFGGSYVRHCCTKTNPENPVFSYLGVDDLLANTPSEVTPTFGSGAFKARMFELGFFVQDDWRATEKLTLNLGLRYDWMSNMVADEVDGSTSALYNADGLLDDQFHFGPLRDVSSPYNHDKLNIGPRFGFAYRMDDKGDTVIRGGFGVLFSPLTPGLAWASVGRNGVPFRTRFQKAEATDLGLKFGVPTKTMREVVAARNLDPNNPFRDTFSFIDPNLQAPYAMHWNIGFQRKITNSMVLESAYVANRGVKYPMHRRANNVIRTGPNAGQKPNPNLAITYYVDNSQMSEYHSWQTSLKKRYSNNFTGGIHYTWSKALANDGGDVGAYYQGDNTGGSVQDFFNVAQEWGPATGDNTQYLAADFLIDLPAMTGMNPVLRGVLGGWQISGIFTAVTGDPFQLGQGSAIPSSRPDATGVDPYFDTYGETLQYLNPDAFSLVPVDPVSGATVRPGSMGKNALRNIGRSNMDFGLGKNFAITERVNFRIRADMFSAFNHQTLNNLNTNINSGTFGRFRGTQGERIIQINTRLTF